MGRAIVREPRAFLMDEPLSNLDAKLRTRMRLDVARLQREPKAETIYVTHDQVEAMTKGDRVAVLRGGVPQQLDRPQLVHVALANLFVASFIGSPPINIVEVRLEQSGGGDLWSMRSPSGKMKRRQVSSDKARPCNSVSDEQLRWAYGPNISKTQRSTLRARLFFEVPLYLRSLRVRRSSFTLQCQ